MKKLSVLSIIVILFSIVLMGCVSTPYGNKRGLFTGQMTRYADPTQQVNPGTVAYSGINGPSGPYAAALGLGNISDPAARADARQVMESVSYNQGWYGGAYGRGGHARAATNRGPHHGAIINNNDHDAWVSINSGQKMLVPAQDFITMNLPPLFRGESHVMDIYYNPSDQTPDRTKGLSIDSVRGNRQHRGIPFDWIAPF